MNAPLVDVVIVGSGIAGAIAALSLSRKGIRVVIIDKKANDSCYKTLCTHFIQPVAIPVLRKLNLEDGLVRIGGVPTKMAIRTRVGMIDPPGPFYDDEARLPALNMERRLFDPHVMAEMRKIPEIEIHLNTTLVSVERHATGNWMVKLETDGVHVDLACRLLVAADGRGSQLAKLFSNEDILRNSNDRACMFGYFDGVSPPPDNRSMYFIGPNDEAVFYYPLGAERALLAAFIPKNLYPDCKTEEEKVRALIHFYSDYPECPDLANARPESEIHGYLNYPNIMRNGAINGIPFVGDAAISLDPMSGSGCSFAIVSAYMMAEEVAEALLTGDDLESAVARYNQKFLDFFSTHAQGITADSRISKSHTSTDAMHRRIQDHPDLQKAFSALTGRLITPAAFQRTFLTICTKRPTQKASPP